MAAYTPSSLLQQRSSGSSGLSRGIGPKAIEDDSEHGYLKDNKDSSSSNKSIVTGEAPRLILPSTMSHTRPAQVTSFTVTQESSLKGSPSGTQPHHYHQHQQHHHHHQQQQQQQQQQHGVGDTSLTNGGGSKRKRFTAAEKMRILGHLEETSNLRATARRFGVDRKTIRSWMEHRDELRRIEEQSKEQEPGVPPQGMEDGLTPPNKRRRNLTPGVCVGVGGCVYNIRIFQSALIIQLLLILLLLILGCYTRSSQSNLTSVQSSRLLMNLLRYSRCIPLLLSETS